MKRYLPHQCFGMQATSTSNRCRSSQVSWELCLCALQNWQITTHLLLLLIQIRICNLHSVVFNIEAILFRDRRVFIVGLASRAFRRMNLFTKVDALRKVWVGHCTLLGFREFLKNCKVEETQGKAGCSGSAQRRGERAEREKTERKRMSRSGKPFLLKVLVHCDILTVRVQAVDPAPWQVGSKPCRAAKSDSLDPQLPLLTAASVLRHNENHNQESLVCYPRDQIRAGQNRA
jgi:hypothetical protein